jgi:hypothetical protein
MNRSMIELTLFLGLLAAPLLAPGLSSDETDWSAASAPAVDSLSVPPTLASMALGRVPWHDEQLLRGCGHVATFRMGRGGDIAWHHARPQVDGQLATYSTTVQPASAAASGIVQVGHVRCKEFPSVRSSATLPISGTASSRQRATASGTLIVPVPVAGPWPLVLLHSVAISDVDSLRDELRQIGAGMQTTGIGAMYSQWLLEAPYTDGRWIDLVADPRHSRGQIDALRINRLNDGLHRTAGIASDEMARVDSESIRSAGSPWSGGSFESIVYWYGCDAFLDPLRLRWDREVASEDEVPSERGWVASAIVVRSFARSIESIARGWQTSAVGTARQAATTLVRGMAQMPPSVSGAVRPLPPRPTTIEARYPGIDFQTL